MRNKCLNERRRRDKENTYFEELAELISASITDMSSFSVKPEKCAILQESLNQIKQIKEETGSSEAVQQSQVSSSKPSVLANDVLGPLLLEALDGFLFVVNGQGKVEFVSENVDSYLKYTQDDLVGKSIYNIIHVGDHAQFSGSLLPMSFGSVISWPNDTVAKGRTFNCRMLVKPPCEEIDDVEVKQTYVSQYENMQISALQQPGEKFSETSESSVGQSCLVCIARRLSITEKTNTMLGIEQFTTKQDTNGKILAFDTSGIAPGSQSCPDFNGQNIQEFCHVNDVQNLAKHFQEVLKTGSNTSSVYRFKFQDNRYFFVQSKSKIFRSDNCEQDFILSTHSIIRECDSENELKGSASTSLMKSIIGQSQVAGTRSNQNLSGISSQMAALETLAYSQSSMNPNMGLNSDLHSMDVLNSNSNHGNWDLLPSDFEAVIGSTNMNFNNSNSSSNSVNSWSDMSQMKLAQQQQQHQQQQQQLLTRTMLAMSKTIRPEMLKFQRGGSFDSSSNSGQKSPRFSPSPGPRSAPFQVPSQRSMMGYPNQRSPGSSVGGMMSNRMSPGMGYPPQRTPPMSSPVSMTQAGWNRLQQNIHQQREFQTPNSLPPLSLSMMSPGQQGGMIGRTSANPSPSPRSSSEFLFSNSSQSSIDKRTIRGGGKLSELLSHSSSSGSLIIRTNSRDSLYDQDRTDNNSVLSPLDSHQSPQPGPGSLSPTEKPQSTTSHDDIDMLQKGDGKKAPKNIILKQLLSQDESYDDEKDDKSESDMNEAEAKKPNALLKQLLSDPGEDKDKKEKVKDKGLQNGELLQFLLADDNNCTTSAPAESTSQDHDLSTRQRHQSAPEEPQSTTSTPSTSKSSTPVLPHLPQRQRHASVEQSTFNRPSSVGLETVKRPTDTSNFIVDKNLDNFLNSLWEKGNETNQIQPQKKRKLSSSEVDSTADQDQANFPNKEGTKLMKENALLAKLLSTKANKEKIVNTGISGNANPSATPQSRLTKDVSQKLLSVKPSLPLLSKTLSDSKLDTGSSNSNTDSFSVGSKEMGQLKNLNQTSSQNKMTDMLNSYNSSSNNIGQDDNSQDTYDSLQRMLFDSQSDNVMEFSEVSESSDPLLNEILQQAEDLKQDLTTPKTPSSSRGPTPAVNNGPLHENAPPVLSDLDLLSQFEQVLKEKNASLDEIDQLLGISNQAMGQAMGLVKTGGPNDMMAIEEIQKELMRDEPIHSNAMPNPMIARALQAQSSMNRQSFMQSMSAMSQSAMSQVPGNGNMDMGFQQISPPNPQQGFQQQQQQNFGLPGPRLPGPPGPLASALSNGMQQRPGFPNSMAMQVRQSLLQQQKLKAQREMEKRRQAAEQARRRALMQAQLSNNFGSRFQPNMDGNSMSVQPFPENLAEMMNSGNAPNVSLQRNQSIPGPMSPRFNPNVMPQNQGMNPQMIGPSTPSSQMSPHFNQQSQWNIRQQGLQSPMGMSQVDQMTSQMNMQRHRSLSGGTNNQSRFQFPEGQFNNNNNSQMGMLQQQSLYSGRMMRQMSMPGRGSPRTSQSPFGNSPDPMLMSPNSISPNNSLRQSTSQISPSYNQSSGVMCVPSSSGGMGAPSSLSPVQNMNQGINSVASSNNGFGDYEMQLDIENKISMNKSDFVKQELRNICNARSEKQMQQINQHHTSQSLSLQSPQQQPLTSPHSQQNLTSPHPQQQPMTSPQLPPYSQHQQQHQHQQQQQQQSVTLDYESEIPLDILDQITEMAKDHGVMTGTAGGGLNLEDLKEEDVLKRKREEAKQVYEKFQALAKAEARMDQKEESNDVIPSTIFRKQLMTQVMNSQNQPLLQRSTSIDTNQVQVVTKEPRTSVDDMKPPDHKNSLLQQLLSE
ncbi:nuclear receptor coactivator 2 [Mytilus galloprovincialis]|uniref:Nuclear receptor coactivator 2 n=2 Tax=Mytilus galloprovincialis TaxID=29158 RepID=A0A8B6EJ13_MYTGA|nr:nuclear receptor coactivator 2 [Mytilus galloprovincialis]